MTHALFPILFCTSLLSYLFCHFTSCFCVFSRLCHRLELLLISLTCLHYPRQSVSTCTSPEALFLVSLSWCHCWCPFLRVTPEFIIGFSPRVSWTCIWIYTCTSLQGILIFTHSPTLNVGLPVAKQRYRVWTHTSSPCTKLTRLNQSVHWPKRDKTDINPQ